MKILLSISWSPQIVAISGCASMLAMTASGCGAVSAKVCESCAHAKIHNHWCDECDVGYVAGIKITLRMLFEAVDAHGHDLVLASIKCPSCQAAIKMNGYCEECKIGWFNKQAYFSRLTYHLARGEVRNVSTIECDTCRRNSEHYGWCDSCRLGMVGNVAIRDRKEFAITSREYDRLKNAVELAGRCEQCALALLTDTPCFKCKISYRNGREVPATAPS